jgi:predicted Fe-S protein YdhL (DUF1289 family)
MERIAKFKHVTTTANFNWKLLTGSERREIERLLSQRSTPTPLATLK